MRRQGPRAGSSPVRDDGRRVARAFAALASGYWRGASAWQAWTLMLGLAATVLLSIAGNVGVSSWNRWFFDGLERKDGDAVGSALLAFVALAIAVTAASVCNVLARETLQVRWRAWLTEKLVGAWLDGRRFYRLSLDGPGITNPEYRITDDVRWATEPVVDFGIGLLTAAVSFVTFIGILWSVGGSIDVGGTAIPAYMVVAALLHGALVMGLMLRFGGSLPQRMEERNEAEAQYRFALIRVRENAETIALNRGEASERPVLARALAAVVGRWMAVVRKDGQLTWILTGNSFMLPVVPVLLAAPKYLTGELSLGAVMQLAAAYVPVQAAIAWGVENFRPVANWLASARRVVELVEAMDAAGPGAEGPRRIAVRPHAEKRLRLVELAVATRDGQPVLAPTSLDIGPGEAVLIVGESGVGKSVLLRAMAGLWPWGQGEVRLAEGASIGFVAQRAYLPLGTLRELLGVADPAAALRQVGLEHLGDRLDDAQAWDSGLSTGERQRLALARVLAQRPDVLLLDEALAPLDERAQASLMALLRHALPGAAIVAVAQRSALAVHCDRCFALRSAEGGARLVPEATDAARRAMRPAALR